MCGHVLVIFKYSIGNVERERERERQDWIVQRKNGKDYDDEDWCGPR